MLSFRPIELNDRAAIHSALWQAQGHGSEFSFANLFFWGEQQVAWLDGAPVFLSRFGDSYTYPFPVACADLQAAVELLRQDARQRGIPFRLFGLRPEEQAALEQRFPGQFRYHPVRNSFDYVYDIERLAGLRGKKLQAKRNHCNRFEAEHPDYRLLPLTQDLLPLCQAFTELWYQEHLDQHQASEYLGERIAIAKAFDHFEALGLEGAVLETEGRVVAFSIGNRIREDTFDVNFEKALADVNGAYPMINREFARRVRERYPQVRLLNREDDMGIEGLRKAKESYYPDLLLEKQLAEEIASC